MAKIKQIYVQNVKSVVEQSADFNGCSAIVIAGNRKGKTTFLTSLIERIRGEKPEIIVRQGQEKGCSYIVLTTGERFDWSISADGKEKLVFTTKDNIKVSVNKEIARRFFPPVFDIDTFLTETPKKQSEILQKLIGVDFTELNTAYKSAFDERTFANRKAKEAAARLLLIDKNLPVEPIDNQELAAEIASVDAHNEKIESFQLRLSDKISLSDAIKSDIERSKFDLETSIIELENKIALLKKNQAEFEAEKTKELAENNADIEKGKAYLSANKVKDAEYVADLKSKNKEIEETNKAIEENNKAIELQKEADKAEEEAKKADDLVKSIEFKKTELLKTAKLPEGFAITDEGVTVDGLPLSKNQLSLSQLYISALKLAALSIGEVRCLHFDASTLDKNSLAEIEAWAVENDMQLLIEKPDFEGGEIQYQIIEG